MNLVTKKAIYYCTRLSQVLTPQFARRAVKPRLVVFYPQFESLETLADHVNRIRWYMPCGADIYLPVDESLDDVDLSALPVPVCQRTPSGGFTSEMRVCSSREIDEKLQRADIVCIWSVEKLSRWSNKLLANCLRVRVVDPEFYLFTESHTYPALLWYDLLAQEERDAWLEESKRNLKKLFNLYGDAKRAYVFGSGPSSKAIGNHTY